MMMVTHVLGCFIVEAERSVSNVEMFTKQDIVQINTVLWFMFMLAFDADYLSLKIERNEWDSSLNGFLQSV